MANFLPKAFYRGKFVKFEEANVSIATHGLHYGTGAFGGLRAIPNPANSNEVLMFRLDRHAKRLSDSAKFLRYDLSAETIKNTIINFIKENKPTTSSYVRPFFCTTELGLVPRVHNIEKDFFIYGMELGDYLAKDGVRCRFSSWTRQEDRSFPLRGKITGAYITSSLAKTEAVESGFDEGILLNTQGKVCEATGMNLFMVRNGKLYTPGVDQDILEGITRDSIITIARDLGLEVSERMIDKSELMCAEELFLCGTAAKVTPIKSIENYTLPDAKPITTKIKETITAITELREPKYKDWVDVIPLT